MSTTDWPDPVDVECALRALRNAVVWGGEPPEDGPWMFGCKSKEGYLKLKRALDAADDILARIRDITTAEDSDDGGSSAEGLTTH